MPNDMPTYCILSAPETRIVKAMRRFMSDTPLEASERYAEPVTSRIAAHLDRFLSLLWRNDPFVVDLNHKYDPDVTSFELQLLYAISEARAGNADTVDELLTWWFADAFKPQAHVSLKMVAELIDETGMPRQSSARLREHILAHAFERRNRKTAFRLDATSRPHSGAVKNTTYH